MASPLGEGQTDMPINHTNLGEVQPTRRLIVTIGVSSLTMQAWDKGNTGIRSKSALITLPACFTALV